MNMIIALLSLLPVAAAQLLFVERLSKEIIRDESGVGVRRELRSVSENGNGALVALASGRRKVFWCDCGASQPESLCARGQLDA